MTYKEWADEYYESAEELRGQIEVLKEKMKTVSGELLAEMSRLLEMKRIMRCECMETARILGRRKGEC